MIDFDKLQKEKIGYSIKYLRKNELKMSRDEFEMGISKYEATLSNIERGKTYPTVDFCVKMSNKYKIPISDFIFTGFNVKSKPMEYDIISSFDENTQLHILQKINNEKYSMLNLYDTLITNYQNKDLQEQYGIMMHNERVKRKKNIEMVAESIEITPKSLRNIESGNNEISFQKLCRFCYINKIPMDYILVGSLDIKSVAIEYLLSDTFRGNTDKVQDYLKEYMISYVKLFKNM